MTRKYEHWRKSGHSNPGGHCVEVARAADGTIGVRDSRAGPVGTILELTPEGWAVLLHLAEEGNRGGRRVGDLLTR